MPRHLAQSLRSCQRQSPVLLGFQFDGQPLIRALPAGSRPHRPWQLQAARARSKCRLRPSQDPSCSLGIPDYALAGLPTPQPFGRPMPNARQYGEGFAMAALLPRDAKAQPKRTCQGIVGDLGRACCERSELATRVGIWGERS